ncbi:MAG: 4-amino-4-deoxy-L-arabinose transferase-like glycosyltransferase [Planctomycetota bacterium]|jgi:4-amino-4-deoxy-L-arabinose transferase-like glycosyltransferase
MSLFSIAGFVRLVVLTAIAAVIFSSVAPEGRDQRFEIDEAEWLTISLATTQQAFGDATAFDGMPPSPYQDADGNPWKVGIHQSTFGFMNPLLPKFVFGGLSLALGHAEYDPLVYPRFAKGKRQNRINTAKLAVFPPLLAIRWIVVLLASLSAALIFIIASHVGGIASGAFAFALFLASPVITDHATRVRTDFFPLTLTLLALLVAIAIKKSLGGERGKESRLRATLVLGLLAGLAVASKLNGALLVLMISAWIPLAWYSSRKFSGSNVLTGVLLPYLIAGLVTVSIYFVFSPHLWPAPVENVGALFEAWEADISHQKDQFGERLGRADTIIEHFQLSGKAVSGEYEPFYAHTGLPIGLPLIVVGALVLVAAARKGQHKSSAKMVLTYILIGGFGTALWLPFGRNNFYIGFGPVVAILQGMALGAPIALWLRSKRSTESDA